MTKPSIITIDGPAASGKSTIGQMLADAIGYLYLDTGSMYRATTLAALKANINITNAEEITLLAQKIELEIKPGDRGQDGRQYTVLLNGHDVTWDLRKPAVDAHVSLVSSYSGVRREMVRRQRLFAEKGNVVMVGRDIGTVVMPDAPLKLYVTASAEERARRRWVDRKAQGHESNYEAILADVNRRDQFDSSREVSPLKAADDAVIINSTGRSPEDILNEILNLINNIPISAP
ncbi:MAG: (d)CMP kinase [Candidatus Promineifilaceae bacterium]|nr:(d)CMP kinase [Candidatus Promineifilaceae bacterium]